MFQCAPGTGWNTARPGFARILDSDRLFKVKHLVVDIQLEFADPGTPDFHGVCLAVQVTVQTVHIIGIEISKQVYLFGFVLRRGTIQLDPGRVVPGDRLFGKYQGLQVVRSPVRRHVEMKHERCRNRLAPVGREELVHISRFQQTGDLLVVLFLQAVEVTAACIPRGICSYPADLVRAEILAGLFPYGRKGKIPEIGNVLKKGVWMTMKERGCLHRHPGREKAGPDTGMVPRGMSSEAYPGQVDPVDVDVDHAANVAKWGK